MTQVYAGNVDFLAKNFVFILQEIGLISLQTIMAGTVRIEKNTNLCFAETISWSAIARHTKRGDNTIIVSTIFIFLLTFTFLYSINYICSYN